MSTASNMRFTHMDAADEPTTPTIAAYFTLTYGDFAIAGGKVIVQRGRAPKIALPRGVTMPDESRATAFKRWALDSWLATVREARLAERSA